MIIEGELLNRWLTNKGFAGRLLMNADDQTLEAAKQELHTGKLYQFRQVGRYRPYVFDHYEEMSYACCKVSPEFSELSVKPIVGRFTGWKEPKRPYSSDDVNSFICNLDTNTGPASVMFGLQGPCFSPSLTIGDVLELDVASIGLKDEHGIIHDQLIAFHDPRPTRDNPEASCNEASQKTAGKSQAKDEPSPIQEDTRKSISGRHAGPNRRGFST
jgi:hypothetical protein